MLLFKSRGVLALKPSYYLNLILREFKTLLGGGEVGTKDEETTRKRAFDTVRGRTRPTFRLEGERAGRRLSSLQHSRVRDVGDKSKKNTANGAYAGIQGVCHRHS